MAGWASYLISPKGAQLSSFEHEPVRSYHDDSINGFGCDFIHSASVYKDNWYVGVDIIVPKNKDAYVMDLRVYVPLPLGQEHPGILNTVGDKKKAWTVVKPPHCDNFTCNGQSQDHIQLLSPVCRMLQSLLSYAIGREDSEPLAIIDYAHCTLWALWHMRYSLLAAPQAPGPSVIATLLQCSVMSKKNYCSVVGGLATPMIKKLRGNPKPSESDCHYNFSEACADMTAEELAHTIVGALSYHHTIWTEKCASLCTLMPEADAPASLCTVPLVARFFNVEFPLLFMDPRRNWTSLLTEVCTAIAGIQNDITQMELAGKTRQESALAAKTKMLPDAPITREADFVMSSARTYDEEVEDEEDEDPGSQSFSDNDTHETKLQMRLEAERNYEPRSPTPDFSEEEEDMTASPKQTRGDRKDKGAEGIARKHLKELQKTTKPNGNSSQNLRNQDVSTRGRGGPSRSRGGRDRTKR